MAKKPAITGVGRPEGFIDDVVIAAAKRASKVVSKVKPVNAVRKKFGKSYYVDFGPEFGKAKVTHTKFPKGKKK